MVTVLFHKDSNTMFLVVVLAQAKEAPCTNFSKYYDSH